MNSGTETREEVMQTSNLHTLLCERVAQDFRGRWERQHPKPPLAALLALLLAWGLFTVFGAETAAWGCLVFAGLLGIYAVWNEVMRITGRGKDIQEEILRGHFAPECASLVLARLRWWNHLIAPQRWARHSRIHERRRQLEAKVKLLEDEYGKLRGEEQEASEELELLSRQEIFNLAGRIKTLAERVEHQARIARVEQESERLLEEMRLYHALLHKVREVTEMLERVDRLEVHLVGNVQTDLTRMVDEACAILEERRRLVTLVDRINPDEFLEMVKV